MPFFLTSITLPLRGYFGPITAVKHDRRSIGRVKSLSFRFISSALVLPLCSGLCLALSGCLASVVTQSQLETLVASPDVVDLGNVPVGNSASASVSVVNSNSVPVTVTEVSLTGQSFSVTGQNSLPISIPAGARHSFNVNFVPAAAGKATGQLTISSNATTSPTLVTLNGTGAAENDTTTPQLTGLTCASASMGGTAANLCTATISAAAASPGFRVALSSNNAAMTTSTAALVQTGNTSVQFTVNVTPVSTAQTATLTATAGSVTETFAIALTVPVPTLSTSAESVAFGAVTVNSPATQTVTLNSTGTAALTISGATVTGAGFTLTPGAFPITLNPGQTTKVSVQFDPSAEGAATGQLSVASNSSANGTAVVALSGTGEPQLTGLTCANASMGGTGTDLCTATLSGPALSPGFRVALSSNNAAMTTSTAALVQTNTSSVQFTVSVTPVSTAQTAILTATAGTVTETFSLALTVPVPALSTSVTSVAFGNVTVNTPVTQTVTVSSTGTAALTISGATVTGSGFSLTSGTFPITLNPGQTTTLSVQYDPSAEGAATGQLSVTSNSTANSTAVVALSGTGEPQLTGLTCTNASMGGTGTDLCTATLSGPALSPGFRVALSSNNAAMTTSTAALVQTNASSVQFTVSVIPVSTAQTAILTATAGAVTKTFSIALTAPTPTLSLSAASVAFGNVSVNTLSTQTVTLTSTGTGALTISAATITGSGFSLAPATFPMTLNPGQTATLSVQFDPSAENAATGQLTISSNSSVNSTATVALSGTGLPQLTGLTCASASMGGTATDLCTVTISGPALSPGFRVVLSSNNSAVTMSPAALVQTNTTSAQFTVNVTPVTSAQTATLTATAGTVTETFALALTVPVPTLTLGVASLSFSTVTVDTPVTQTVTLSSTGTAAVSVSGATVTGAGFTLLPGSFPITLAPGQTATLTVQFDPSVEGAATGQLTVTSNSSVNSAATVSLSGTGLPQLTGISCANASMTGSGTNLCTVTIGGPALAPGFRVALSSNNAAVTMSPAALVQTNTSSAQFTANVTLVSTAQAVTLTANAGAVTETFALQLNAALPALSLSTASVAFGNVAINVAESQTVTMENSGAAPLTISAASIKGTGFTLIQSTLPVTLNPGQAATLGVQFDPTAAGASTGQLTITSNSSVNGAATVPLSGTGSASGNGTFSYGGSPLETTLIPQNQTTPISPDFFGITIHHTATPFPEFPVSTFRFWDVAAWSTVEPASGQFLWDHIDTAIATGKANGISDYIFTFGSVPAWASTDPTEPCVGGDGVGTCAPPDMTDFDSFTTQLVQRYCGVIKYYETWNEPNNPFYWSGTDAQLVTVAQHVEQIATDPANCGCTNGVCSVNGGANPNHVLLPPISRVNQTNLTWLSTYLAAAPTPYPYADIVAFHGYGAAEPETIVSQVADLHQTLSQNGLGALPVWNTEASWGTQPTVDQDQASWLMRYHVALAATGVSRFVWYAYDNCGWGTLWEAPWCTDPQMPVSQVTAPGQAYPVIENWLSGATLSECQEYENGLWACELQRTGGYVAWMVWSSTGDEISVPIPASSGLAVYRDWQNNLNTLGSNLNVDEMPVLLENWDL